MLRLFFAIITIQLTTKTLLAVEQELIQTHDNVFLCETNSGSTEYFFNFEDLETTTFTNSEEWEIIESESSESLSIFDENIAIINYPSLSNFVLINLENGKKIDANDNRSNCLKVSYLLKCEDNYYHYFGLRDDSLAYKWRYISTAKESSFMSFEYLNDQKKANINYSDGSVYTYDFNLGLETSIRDGVTTELSCENIYSF
jgi:hypothetical protein